MNKPLISVIIPIYNVEKYLRQCLDSVINQTLTDIEIICVNDGSTDNSLQIINEYSAKDDRIKVINKKNSGYGDSMNKGFEIATGEYIGIVESDDFIENNMFEDLYNLAKKHDADMVKSDFNFYYGADNKKIKANNIYNCPLNEIILAKEHIVVFDFLQSIWSAIYKKDFLIKNKISFLPTPGASYQDTSFAFKVLALAKIVLTDKAYLNYRLDNENSSVNSKSKVYAICDEYDELTRFLDEHQELKWLNTKKLANEYTKGYMWNLGRIAQPFKEEFIDYFSNKFKNYYKDDCIQKDFFLIVKKDEFETLIKKPAKFKKYYFSGTSFSNLTTLQKIFSVKNSPDRRHKIITVLGIKFKIKKR